MGKDRQSDKNSFFQELRAEVFAYLKEHSLDPIDQRGLLTKAIINYSLWFSCYVAYLYVGSHWGFQALWLAPPLSFAMLCIVLSVMHDGSHGSFSHSKTLNWLAKQSLGFAGASSILWYKLHVRAHHDNTNVIGYDQDFESGGLIRLHWAQPSHKMHRFQHLYAWFLYSGQSMRWIWMDDFHELSTNRWNLTKEELRSLLKEVVVVKLWHFSSYLLIPFLVTQNWQLTLLFYAIHWLLLSVSLVSVFAMAHLSEKQEMFKDKKDSNVLLIARHPQHETKDITEHKCRPTFQCFKVSLSVAKIKSSCQSNLFSFSSRYPSALLSWL